MLAFLSLGWLFTVEQQTAAIVERFGRFHKAASQHYVVLNGKAIDLSKTRLFDGPFLSADVGSEKLTMTYKGKKRVLDFKAVKVTE